MEIVHFKYCSHCLSIGLEQIDDYTYKYVFGFKHPKDRLNTIRARKLLYEIREVPEPCSRAGKLHLYNILPLDEIAKLALAKIKKDHSDYIPKSYKNIIDYMTIETILESD